ncbi:MAG: hypothetical protein ACOVLI_00895, partial [Rhabdaerophilum sp.]
TARTVIRESGRSIVLKTPEKSNTNAEFHVRTRVNSSPKRKRLQSCARGSGCTRSEGAGFWLKAGYA